MSRNFKWFAVLGSAVLIAALLVILTAGTVLAQRSTPWGGRSGSDWGHGRGGMMSGWGQQDGFQVGDCGFGGMGHGMMGGWGVGDPGDGTRLTPDQAAEAAESYLAAFGDPDLVVAELMEFSANFYVQVEEQSSGIHAFELLINPYTGAVYPEPGPNMMWNAKYGHMSDDHMGGWGGMMGGWGGMMGGYGYRTPSDEMSVSPAEAVQAAQAYLDRFQPGRSADDHADEFYGYYTLHVLEDEQIVGMLSVHGTSGQVWYHTWHGDFIGMGGIHE